MPQSVRRVLHEAVRAYADDHRVVAALHGHLERFEEPLRVAIAGKVKAGKSTLLNALIGEQIAPTDAGECTKVVTWYQYADSPQVVLEPRHGQTRQLPLRRSAGRLDLGLQGAQPAEVERLVVDWPARSLRASTLIDTPGIDSLTTDVSARTTDFLTPEDEPSSADAVLYLMRHLHASDVSFLEAFHDQAAGRATMVNAIGVLSRADEVGVGRIDSLISAERVARRYREDPTLRTLCHTVVPVAGLLAETARTLRQAEFSALQALADLPHADTAALLRSVDRFVRPDPAVPISSEERTALLDRLGIFGVRLSIAMIRGGLRDVTALAQDLVRRSGLDEVRRLLAIQFTERRDLLKARSALLALDRILVEVPREGTGPLAEEVERILAGAHGFRELRLLTVLRTPGLQLPPDAVADAEQLLGGRGTHADVRLGLSPEAEPAEQRQRAMDALQRWRARTHSPLTNRATAGACQVVIRSCEGILATLPSGGGRGWTGDGGPSGPARADAGRTRRSPTA